MKPEISFLMDLFLDEEVPAIIKKKLATRMREVEKSLVSHPAPQRVHTSGFMTTKASSLPPVVAAQSPSMQRLMQNNPDLIPKPPVPVTPEAAQALNARQKLILGSGNEKPEQGRTSPRKF